MANVSISLTVANSESLNPQLVVVGSAAPGTGDIELRVNTTNVPTLKQLYIMLEELDYFVKDENLGPSTFKIL